MPVQKMEISKGFWITVGVVLALIIVGMISALFRRVTSGSKYD